MTKNQKLILGVGAIALAYWLFKNKGQGVATTTQPQEPSNTGDIPVPAPSTSKVYYCKDGFKNVITTNPSDINKRYANPCEGHGGIDELKTFKAIQDYIEINGKIFLYLGEGMHKIKRKAEQIACNEALQKLKSYSI